MYKFYYIYGCDQIYGGLHGMYKSGIASCADDDEAIEWARDFSQDVIESYNEIYNDLEDQIFDVCELNKINYKDDGPDVANIRDQIYEEDMDYFAVLLNGNELPSDDIDELNDLLWEIGDDEFLQKYSLRNV